MVRASSPDNAHFLPELFMATKGHGIRRAKASSLAKSSSLATDSDIHSQRSPRPWAIGCSTPSQSSMIDGSRHPADLLTPTTVRSPNPTLPLCTALPLQRKTISLSAFFSYFHKKFYCSKTVLHLCLQKNPYQTSEKISENSSKFSGIHCYWNKPELSLLTETVQYLYWNCFRIGNGLFWQHIMQSHYRY